MIYATPISGVEYELEPFWSIDMAIRPRPQPRPRFNKGRVFSNSKLVAKFKAEIAVEIGRKNNAPPPDRDVPIHMELEIGIPVQNKRKWGTFHTGRPDSDNILKAVKDAIVDCGVLGDDSQVVATEICKTYCPAPGLVRIRLSRIIVLP